MTGDAISTPLPVARGAVRDQIIFPSNHDVDEGMRRRIEQLSVHGHQDARGIAPEVRAPATLAARNQRKALFAEQALLLQIGKV